MLKGPNLCVVFDSDFDSYLIDHALPIKSLEPYNRRKKMSYFDKSGYIEEDVRNLMRVSIHF
jgi:hypothetical protein